MPHALVIDDDQDSLEMLAQLVMSEGFTVGKAESLRAARMQLVRQQPAVLITDLMLPDGEGTDLIGDLEERDATQVVVITGHASVDSAINALRVGATDYIRKPIDVQRLKAVLARVPRDRDLKAEIGQLRGALRTLGRFGPLRGNSPVMQTLYDQLERVARTSATVLLVGESGTGKELCAEAIHDASPRKKQPFLAVNCGAVSPQLIESELFGHEKGSFTGADRQHKGYFERASGGTLLLDEVTEMPAELQVKLLRVLETGSFTRVGTTQPILTDVRVIAATNRIPERAVAEGKLREDLYHRLNVFPIRVPPLRERGTDIELLARAFLEILNQAEARHKTFTASTIARLYAHSWPGNVRELKNHVQRAYIMADEVIDEDHASGSLPDADHAEILTIRVGTPLEEVERRLTLATLAAYGNVKRKAADVLGISLKTLYNRLEYYASKGLIDRSHEAMPVRARPGDTREHAL